MIFLNEVLLKIVNVGTGGKGRARRQSMENIEMMEGARARESSKKDRKKAD